jgi:hypothetical protein
MWHTITWPKQLSERQHTTHHLCFVSGDDQSEPASGNERPRALLWPTNPRGTTTQPLRNGTMNIYKIGSVCRLTNDTYCDCCKKSIYENKSHDIETLYNMNHLHLTEIYLKAAGDCTLTILQLTDINRDKDKLKHRYSEYDNIERLWMNHDHW